MTNRNFKLQTITCNIVIRSTRNTGICSVNLGIAIDGAHDRIPLGIFWPTDRFDRILNRLMPRYKGDEECYQHNLVIDKNLAVANQLRLQIYAFPQKVTTKEFKLRFRQYDSRENFLDYMSCKIKELYQNNLIKKHTRDNNMAVLQKLIDYKISSEWTFASIRASDLQLYFNWCISKGKIEKNSLGQVIRRPLAYNTIVGHFKIIAKYFTLAQRDKIPFENPFEHFNVGDYQPGVREVIDATELRTLYEFRKDDCLTIEQKRVLDKFLIGCFTGLRKSDIEQLSPKKHIQNGVLYLNPEKTTSYGTKIKFRLPKQAVEILRAYSKDGFGFHESSLLNKTIKIIACKAGISKYIKFHSSRDCFAVLYLKFGGNLADLKDILGHKRLSTTEIYLKMGSDAKNDTMSKFEGI